MIQGTLFILKIIGIIFLIIVSILILLLCLLLFVPIRYHVVSEKKEVVFLKAKLHWLFHFITVDFFYQDSFRYVVRVFGIPLVHSQKETASRFKRRSKHETSIPEEDEHDTPLKSKSTEHQSTNTKNTEAKKTEDNKTEDNKTEDNKTEHNKTEPNNTEPNNTEHDNTTQKKKRKIDRGIHKLLTKIQYTFHTICDKIKEISKQIDYYVRVLKDPACKQALEVSLKQIHSLLNSIRPRKFQIHIEIGTEDPATLGTIMSWYGVFYPIYTHHIQIYPEFEKEIFVYDAFLKGRIRIARVVIVLSILYFDKNIRRIISLLKREEL